MSDQPGGERSFVTIRNFRIHLLLVWGLCLAIAAPPWLESNEHKIFELPPSSFHLVMAGYWDTRLQERKIPGPLPWENIIGAAWIVSREGVALPAEVVLWHQGFPLGTTLLDNGRNGDKAAGDGLYWLHYHYRTPMAPKGRYLIEMRWEGPPGGVTDPWPYLVVRE